MESLKAPRLVLAAQSRTRRRGLGLDEPWPPKEPQEGYHLVFEAGFLTAVAATLSVGGFDRLFADFFFSASNGRFVRATHVVPIIFPPMIWTGMTLVRILLPCVDMINGSLPIENGISRIAVSAAAYAAGRLLPATLFKK